jgi:hypothetical protein
MTPGIRALLIVVSLGIVIWAWMFRIDAKDGGNHSAIVTDRWSGTVYLCDLLHCYQLHPETRK